MIITLLWKGNGTIFHGCLEIWNSCLMLTRIPHSLASLTREISWSILQRIMYIQYIMQKYYTDSINLRADKEDFKCCWKYHLWRKTIIFWSLFRILHVETMFGNEGEGFLHACISSKWLKSECCKVGNFPTLQQPIGLPLDFPTDGVIWIKLDPAYRQRNFDKFFSKTLFFI